MPTTNPIDLHLDVGVVRAGHGIPSGLAEELEAVVVHVSEATGRVVDLTASAGGEGDRRWIELRCWLAGLATVTTTGRGETVERALAAARRDLLRDVAALEPVLSGGPGRGSA